MQVLNDNSNDDTQKIINKIRLKDNRINCIIHNNNMGVYSSRIEAILNAKGKYNNYKKILYNFNGSR